MSNKQLITALGICLSLSSMIAAAETTTAIQPNVENTATFDTAATSAQKSELTADEINTYNNLAIQENRPTLIGRSLNKIGEIGNQSIEQIGVLGSKIAVNASASQPSSIKDPFEQINRKIYKFNMKLDQYILLPIARTYKKVVPNPVQSGVTQFFRNLSMPWTAVNNLLQGHPGTSIESLSRFVINTTTTLGFYDVAGALGVERSDEDFGQTLGVWGIGSGPYVMLPFFGPSTVRDTFGRVVDQYGVPQAYLDNNWERVGITGLKYVNLRARLIGLENFVQGDQYTLLRDVYLQNRQFKSTEAGTSTPDAGTDSFGDDGFGDEGSIDTNSDQQKSQNTDSPVTLMPQTESDTTQISTQSNTADITADTPMDASAAVMLVQSAQF